MRAATDQAAVRRTRGNDDRAGGIEGPGKNIEYQQNPKSLPMAILILSAKSTD